MREAQTFSIIFKANFRKIPAIVTFALHFMI